MSFQFVNASGQKVNLARLMERAAGRPKPVKESLKRVDSRREARRSEGFMVLGYTPEMMSDAEAAFRAEVTEYTNDPVSNKHPGTLDEFLARWMKKNKPKRARSKPYEIKSAADTCAELCRKAGWSNVHVREQLKG